MKIVPVRCKIHSRDFFSRNIQDLLDITCGRKRIGNNVCCPPRRPAIARLHYLLLPPWIDGNKKRYKVMDRNHHRTLKQRRRVKRTVKQVQLVYLFTASKFERRERRIFSRTNGNDLQLEFIESWHRIEGINIDHKFTTSSGQRRQQSCHITPYSGFV